MISILRLSIADILQIIIVILKLTGTIDWSWWWVFSPTIFLLCAIGLLTRILEVVAAVEDKRYWWNQDE